MKPLETGLRHRLRRAVRQIAAQHLHLRSAHQAVADAAAAGNPGELATCVDRLCGAIDAHFSLEENVFFPALHGLHPESERDLQGFVHEHAVHRSELERLRALVAGKSSPEFLAGYRAFAAATADHERREERLLAALSHLFDGTD
jgi:iron-sulfur cluster repair protein YtfE (RIC family)